MKIKNNFTQKEIELLENINVNIEDRDYTEQEILVLSKNIYKNGYHDTNITYKEAESYKNMSERLKIFSKVDIDKVNKYTKKEFDNDFFIATNLMHNVVWNSPERINIHRKNIGEKLLTLEEYEKCKKIRKEHQEKFERFMEFLKEKYGQDLNAVSNYYSLR